MVTIRVVVEGATGHVVEAEALDDAKDTALGACLAEQVLRIEYPSFRNERLSFKYRFRRPDLSVNSSTNGGQRHWSAVAAE